METNLLSTRATTPSLPPTDFSRVESTADSGVMPASQGARGALAPTVVAGVALLAHALIPNRQTAPPTRLYPKLLIILLGSALIVAIVQWAWRRSRPWVAHHGPLMAGAIAMICIWDLITLKFAWFPLPYFPGPDMVLQGMLDDRVLLLESAYHSLVLLLTGYGMGVAAGLSSGILIGWFRRLHYWATPVMKVIGPIPATAYIPLVMALFTSSFLSGAALIALAVWFPMTMLTSSGVLSVPVAYLDVARTLGAGRNHLIFRVAVPAAMPSIFLGLFMGLCAAFLTLIAAETVGVKSGLGWYLKWQQGYVEYAKVYGALLIMATFFSGLMTLLFKLRDWALGWQKGVIRW